MATVTGNYVDSAGVALPTGAVPQIEFIPSKNAVTVDGKLISTKPRTVTPNATTGAFSVDLIPTVDVLDVGFHYLARGFYLVPNGYGAGGGFTRHDLFQYELHVPSTGGQIGELVTGGRPFESFVIVSLTQPAIELPGTYWLMADPAGDPSLGNGDLYKVV